MAKKKTEFQIEMEKLHGQTKKAREQVQAKAKKRLGELRKQAKERKKLRHKVK